MTKYEFNSLVVEQSDSLKHYAKKFTNDTEDANDLVQDTMLKAVTYFNNFRRHQSKRLVIYYYEKYIH